MSKKNRTTSLPDTVFLRGKDIILYREAKKAATGTLAVVKQWSGAECCLQAAKFKPLSTVSGVVEEKKAPRRGHQQEDHYRTLATCHYDFGKMLIKHSFRGLADRQNAGRVFHVALRSAGARLRGKWSKVTARACTSFMVQRRLCSHVTEEEKKTM